MEQQCQRHDILKALGIHEEYTFYCSSLYTSLHSQCRNRELPQWIVNNVDEESKLYLDMMKMEGVGQDDVERLEHVLSANLSKKSAKLLAALQNSVISHDTQTIQEDDKECEQIYNELMTTPKTQKPKKSKPWSWSCLCM